jgi:CubicO group peptidase (beta-lactamase class C family)
MNVLCHAIATVYGLYDSRAPERLPGSGQLIQEKLRDPIGAAWTYRYWNFPPPPDSLTGIFGYYSEIDASARDLARLGLLWMHWGRWKERQVVPEDWMHKAARTAPDIRANCLKDQWCYGYAFWTNEHSILWPSLPRDSFAASGAGRIHVWVCPSLGLVVVQSPGIYEDQKDNDSGVLGRLVEALS